MAKKKTIKFIGIVLIIIAVLFVVAYAYGSTEGVKNPFGKQTQYQCDVTLDNPTLGYISIEHASCNKVGSCSSTLSIAPQSWLASNEGTIQVCISGICSSKGYSVGEIGSETYTLKLCSDDSNNAKIKVYDTQGEIRDKRDLII